MDWSHVKNNWGDIKDRFHTKWSKLTEEDITAISGKRDELVSRLRKHYDLDKVKAGKVVDEFVRELR